MGLNVAYWNSETGANAGVFHQAALRLSIAGLIKCF